MKDIIALDRTSKTKQATLALQTQDLHVNKKTILQCIYKEGCGSWHKYMVALLRLRCHEFETWKQQLRTRDRVVYI